MELFTGLTPPSALDVVVRGPGSDEELLEITPDAVEEHLDRLRSSLHDLHKEVVDVK
ncbi:hypothetical protein L914_16106 [Phytophthora nicotianae]|uniref:Uncharacterized protein n=1 Tax=Phytophthora nicotianae TaxID=4792 RepID=W2MNY1_PHYNI|nr:hypothetical protein L914_16106 [Phytophthora nicotianae]